MRQPPVAGQLRRAGASRAARFAQRVLEIPGLVGRTTGCGKTSTTHASQLPVNDVWLYPLSPDFQRFLAE